MKKVEANRYPNSATLFKFCKQALEIRYDGNVKVIDQDVGAILGYDPADCSHWKKGKKNIRSLATLKSIADHLNVDERLLIDIASGQIGLEEAIFEFRGYGQFRLAEKSVDNLKKDFFQDPTQWRSGTEQPKFDEVFGIDRETINKLVQVITSKLNTSTLPIDLAEAYNLYPNLKLVVDEQVADTVTVNQVETTFEVRYGSHEPRPFIRFLLAKYLFVGILKTKCDQTVVRLFDLPDELVEISSNVFAGLLLIPNKSLADQVAAVDSSFDLVNQLATIFGVSKTLMNQRLNDFLQTRPR